VGHEQEAGRSREPLLCGSKLWGEVSYTVRIMQPSGATAGRIWGSLRAVIDPLLPLRFFDIAMSGRPPALQMGDGRWLLCLLQPDGHFKAASDIKPAGPQPKL
jgi:hypothetical protein